MLSRTHVIRKELDPYGFIGKYQGFQALGKNVDQVAEAIFLIISKNPKTRNRIISCLVDLLLLSNNKKEALERINALQKINDLPKERIIQMKTRFTENNNLKDNEIIRYFNELTKQYNIEGVKIMDFDKVLETEIDDLPF